MKRSLPMMMLVILAFCLSAQTNLSPQQEIVDLQKSVKLLQSENRQLKSRLQDMKKNLDELSVNLNQVNETLSRSDQAVKANKDSLQMNASRLLALEQNSSAYEKKISLNLILVIIALAFSLVILLILLWNLAAHARRHTEQAEMVEKIRQDLNSARQESDDNFRLMKTEHSALLSNLEVKTATVASEMNQSLEKTRSLFEDRISQVTTEYLTLIAESKKQHDEIHKGVDTMLKEFADRVRAEMKKAGDACDLEINSLKQHLGKLKDELIRHSKPH
jgi:prefoldin subunit 5